MRAHTSARNVARTSPNALGLATDSAASAASVAPFAMPAEAAGAADAADEGSVCSLALIVSIGCSGMRANAPEVALASMMERSERDCSEAFVALDELLESDGLDEVDADGWCGRGGRDGGCDSGCGSDGWPLLRIRETRGMRVFLGT